MSECPNHTLNGLLIWQTPLLEYVGGDTEYRNEWDGRVRKDGHHHNRHRLAQWLDHRSVVSNGTLNKYANDT